MIRMEPNQYLIIDIYEQQQRDLTNHFNLDTIYILK